MSLTFGAATSDRVDCGTLGSYDPLVTTVCGWWYPTTFTSPRRLFSKTNGAGTLSFAARVATTNTGNIRINRARNGSDAGQLVYDTTAVFTTLNQWYFIAIVMDTTASAGNIFKVYVGAVGTAPTAASFASTFDGTGSFDDISSGSFIVGCNASASQAFRGSIAQICVINAALTAGQVNAAWQRAVSSQPCKLLMMLGYNGVSTQPDWSGNGNAGTVTGATLTPDHVGLPPLFGFDRALPQNKVRVPQMQFDYRRRRI